MSYFDDITFLHTGRDRNHRVLAKGFNTQYLAALEFTRRGTIQYGITGEKRYLLEAPVIYWLKPDTSYDYGPIDGGDRDHTWCCFMGKRAVRIVKGLDEISPRGFIHVRNPLELGHYFDRIIELVPEENLRKTHIAAAYLEQIMSLLTSEARNVFKNKSDFYPIREVAGQIREKCLDNWDFQAFSRDKLHMSYSSFRKKFKTIIGEAPYDYLLLCRMQRAAGMLRRGNLMIKEVAEKCGFDDVSSFSRLFKKKAGISPSKYLERSQAR